MSQNGNDEEDVAVETGICHASILNQSKYFHVVGGLPGDAMHDILEGVLQYEAKKFLKHAILDEKYLSLQELNDLIVGFDYGYSNDKNRPSAINRRTLHATHNSLKQSGIGMFNNLINTGFKTTKARAPVSPLNK